MDNLEPAAVQVLEVDQPVRLVVDLLADLGGVQAETSRAAAGVLAAARECKVVEAKLEGINQVAANLVAVGNPAAGSLAVDNQAVDSLVGDLDREPRKPPNSQQDCGDRRQHPVALALR